ncbi:FxSxx-COOH system tetratricopeptide repeat protein [Micromonospora chersina]
MSNAESGKHLPRREVVEAFVRGCGVPKNALQPWRDAWQRAYENRQSELQGVKTDLARGIGEGLRDNPLPLPTAWKVPPPNRFFVGRTEVIHRLAESMPAPGRVAVHALVGLGGVGKTQVAAQYIRQFAQAYDAVCWIACERPELIGEQFAAFAVAAGLVPEEAKASAGVAAAQAYFRSQNRVLLVFDDVEARDDVLQWLPDKSAHVLITSRNPLWVGVAEPLVITEFARDESVVALRAQLPSINYNEAHRLAWALGDLPLAIAQAADFLGVTGMSVDTYLDALKEHAVDLLGNEPPPAGYPSSLAAAVIIAAERVNSEDQAARQLLTLAAHLSSEPIPVDVFRSAPCDLLPNPLAAIAGSEVSLIRAAVVLNRYGLARVVDMSLQLHPLTQAILRGADRNPEDSRNIVGQLLVASKPGDPFSPASWPRWSLLLPHILSFDPVETGIVRLSSLAYDAVAYLLARGEVNSALPLAEKLYAVRTRDSGPDSEAALVAAGLLAHVYRQLGEYAQARRLSEDTMARSRRILGDDHPHTLTSANGLAIELRALGQYEQARQLSEETLLRRRRVLGDDHPDTLTSADTLARDLRALGQYEQARALDEDIVARRRQVLGDDHPHTLMSVGNLARDLRALGEYEQARTLDEETLARCRRILGDLHPDTLTAANNLARDLRVLGQYEQARQLSEETLLHRRGILGDDHPDTLTSAGSLARDLRALGQYEQARALDEDTLTRRRRVLGDDHPHTLTSASSLAIDLRALGEYEQARALDEDTLTRRRRVLGDDHPHTLTSARSLAIDLRARRQHKQALELSEETPSRHRRELGDDQLTPEEAGID